MGNKHETFIHTFQEHPCPKCGTKLHVFADVESKSIEKRVGNFLGFLKEEVKLCHWRMRTWIRYVCHWPGCGWKGNWIKIQDIVKEG